MIEASAWAVINADGTINVSSVALTEAAAIDKWLEAVPGVKMAQMRESYREKLWQVHKGDAVVVEVTVSYDPPQDAA